MLGVQRLGGCLHRSHGVVRHLLEHLGDGLVSGLQLGLEALDHFGHAGGADDGLCFDQVLLQQSVDLAALLSHDQRFFKDVVQRAAALDAKHAQ